jgi:hypothetical protein
MSTPEQGEIAALKAKIEGYESDLAAANAREKAVWAALITAKENRLTELLRAQNAAASSAAFTGVEGWQFYSVILF